MCLDDKISSHKKAVLISGCDSGLGLYLAKRLDSKGYQVFASCLFPNGKGAEELRNQCSDKLKVLEMDVTKDDSVKAAFQFVKNNLGDSVLWAIVNNAGILKGFTTEFADIQVFKDTMEVNAFGMVRVTKMFLPLLKQSRGRIINVTSFNGRFGMPYNTLYVMSKFAATGFNDSLRIEMQDWGIRVIVNEAELFRTKLVDVRELGKNFDAEAADVTPEVIKEYGTKYFEDLRLAMQRTVRTMTSPKVDLVVNDLEDAVSAEYPCISYGTSRNFFSYLISSVLKLFPHVLGDIFRKIVIHFSGCPKPKAA